VCGFGRPDERARVRLRPVIAFSGVPGALWATPGPRSGLGSALTTVPDFVLVAVAIFLVVRQIDKLRRETGEAPAPASTRECPFRAGAIPIQATRCPRRTSQLAWRWVRPGRLPGGAGRVNAAGTKEFALVRCRASQPVLGSFSSVS